MLKDFLPPHIYRIEGEPNYFDPISGDAARNSSSARDTVLA